MISKGYKTDFDRLYQYWYCNEHEKYYINKYPIFYLKVLLEETLKDYELC